MRSLLMICGLLFIGHALQAQALKGKVTDQETGEELLFANIQIFKNEVFVDGISTDIEGNYSIKLDPGTYSVEASYTGYQSKKVTGVLVKAGQITTFDIQMGQGVLLDEVEVVAYKVPLIEQDNTTSGATITGEQIQSLPTKNIAAIAATAAGASAADEGDDVTIRGSRDESTVYMIDGIRVRGSGNLVPQTEIEQLQIITGGIEAKYGDVTGGIISITTKGPSAKYTGSIEAETSEFLDPYGYNLLVANLSGPILKKKMEDGTEKSLIGFRVSGQYRLQKDNDPPATEIYRVTDDRLAFLQENPVTGNRPTAETFTDDDIEILDYQPNEETERLDLTAKLDFRLSDAIDLTLTGSYNDVEDFFTPNENSRTLANWRVFNSHNNPVTEQTQYRGNLRFRHKIGAGKYKEEEGADDSRRSIISNVEYTIQAGFERRERLDQSSRHRDRLFDYGYIGNFGFDWIPTFDTNFVAGQLVVEHADYGRRFTGYEAGTINPTLANYNKAVVDPESFDEFLTRNGVTIGGLDEVWNAHTNVGTVYNLFRRTDNEIQTLQLNASFDLAPKGSDGGVHAIEFGILAEQRFISNFGINPRQLWLLSQQQANRFISGLDTTQVIDSLNGIPIYAAQVDELGAETRFFNAVRNITGQSNSEFVNVDALRPDQLSLDLFSASELANYTVNNASIISFYGYDHTGKQLERGVTFEDFFTQKDANGARTFAVAAVNPIYTAAYIQDKFQYKDIIFRLGLRVDRYDANTQVLKDPYSLYEIQTASDFYASEPDRRPANVGDDYAVYVNSSNVEDRQVKAFRDGDQWYTSEGTPVNSGSLIFGTEQPFPKLARPGLDIKDDNYDISNSFEDYEPQVNWLPRLAFSFPISEDANFFAHYDILAQRPPARTEATALTYYYFYDRGGTDANPFSNANLKPEKTIDYEVGFQQKISNSSSIKLSAYYKELRDMIQRRTYANIPVIGTYVTFDNLDFGTVKGFNFQYDLRRTGNVSLQANYTLQFADGTGSDENSQRGISTRGVLRNLFPLSFDERHRLVATLDYRYGSGKSYNGPRIMGKNILERTGLNIQTIAVSGRPYTAKLQPARLDGAGTIGQINGSRLPWNFTINARLDKSFAIQTGGDDGRKLNFNVYLRVQNVLDRRNIINVYPATGSASDDGYLQSSVGLSDIASIEQQQRNVQSFLDSYQWRLVNPNFYALPRRIFLGAIFNF